MTQLLLAAALFLGIHLFISGTRLRDVCTRMLGAGGYQAVFSLVSLGAIVWLAMSYNGFVGAAENAILWTAPIGLLHSGVIIMAVAVLFVMLGLTTPGPTTAGMEGQLEKGAGPRGIHRITRHPFLWGAFIWAAFHLAANGDAASLILFGTFVLLTFFGTRSIDAKRARLSGASWEPYRAQTSNVPFAAVIQGRSGGLGLGEVAWWQWLTAAIAFGALLYFHSALFKVSPMPGVIG